MSVSIRNVRKEFENFPALHDVSLDIKTSELIALLGPSGSGKTTLLRLIAGLESPTAGSVFFGNEDASHRSVQERNVGFVFQHYALFRHMTVADNIGFGLKVRPSATRPSKADIRARAIELLRLVQLSGLENRYPAQLSGGQRQRVAPVGRGLHLPPLVAQGHLQQVGERRLVVDDQDADGAAVRVLQLRTALGRGIGGCGAGHGHPLRKPQIPMRRMRTEHANLWSDRCPR